MKIIPAISYFYFSAISVSFPARMNFSFGDLLATLQTCQGRVDIRWWAFRPIRTQYEWCLVRSCHAPRSAVTLERRCGTNPPVPCDNMLRLFTLIYMRVHRDSHWQWLQLSSCVQQLPPPPAQRLQCYRQLLLNVIAYCCKFLIPPGIARTVILVVFLIWKQFYNSLEI